MLKTWNITIPKLTGREKRHAYLYLPDSFQTDPTLRYPVLYMFDGHNLFSDEEATYGKSWGLLDYMDKTQTQMIIAAVECNHSPDGGRLSEYSPFTCNVPQFGGKLKGRGRTTMEWLVKTFKPEIDRKYPTLPDREHTFIGGSSMGGLMSLYAVTRYNKYFSRAAALSPSVWFAEDQLEALLRTAPLAEDTVVYMDYGSRELGFHSNMAAQFAAVAAMLLERKVCLNCRIVPGGNHNEASWEQQIPFFMDTLLYGLN